MSPADSIKEAEMANWKLLRVALMTPLDMDPEGKILIMHAKPPLI